MGKSLEENSTKENFFSQGYPPMVPLDSILTLEGVSRSFSYDEIFRSGHSFIHETGPVGGVCFVAQSGVLLADVPFAADETVPEQTNIYMEIARNGASLWSKEYLDIGGEAVIEKRYWSKISPVGGESIIRLIPKMAGPGHLFFDVYILNKKGELCEYGGIRLSPRKDSPIQNKVVPAVPFDQLLEKIRAHCTDASIVALDTITACAEQTLSPAEHKRFSAMKGKRASSFLAARLALKTISRRISNNDLLTMPGGINTVLPDKRPVCPALGGGDVLCCSVSHDRRFAIAVVSPRPVGIDVEEISKRLISPQRFYINEQEKMRAGSYPSGIEEALARIWTLKEALSKALNISLPGIWSRAEVHDIGPERSIYSLDNLEGEAFHITEEGHLFTLVHG